MTVVVPLQIRLLIEQISVRVGIILVESVCNIGCSEQSPWLGGEYLLFVHSRVRAVN